MSLDPTPKPVYFQDVPVGERFTRTPDGFGFYEKLDGEYARNLVTWKKVYFYPLWQVYKK